MRALANDREITAMLGVPVRRVEAAAWLGSGLVCGLRACSSPTSSGSTSSALTFLVIPALAAALIGQLRSLWVTLAAGFVIGIVQSCLTAFSSTWPQYRTMTPFVLAIIALLWFAGAAKPRASGTDVSGWPSRRPALRRRGAPRLQARARDVVASARSSSSSSAGCSSFALSSLPALLDSYWLQIMTAVVIYSIVTLGLGLLIGRVGMVSLCQFVLLAVGAWVALRLELRHLDPLPARCCSSPG